MEPRQEKPKTAKPRTEQKTKRFRLIKLEQRIAPTGYDLTIGPKK
jgi:hypothetical protein